MKNSKLHFLLLLMFSPCLVLAQETPEHQPKLRGAVMMAYSWIPHAVEGGKSVAVIPTFGFDVDYYFHRRWSAAVQVDVKLQSFEVEEKNNVILDRSYPVSLAVLGHYHALRHWSFYLGPGIEVEQHKNLFLVKLGTEYTFEVNENFEIALNFIYENREELYDGFTFGVAFNKVLSRR